MASINNNMSLSEFQEPLSNISDSSFVILGHGSVEPQRSDNFDNNDLTTSKSTLSAFESVSSNPSGRKLSKLDGSSLFEEEIQNKLDELIKENYQLKETLNQNNIAIKSQLDTFFMWQQEVLKTHESHKQKFLETKDLILKLRTENSNLKKQLNEPSNGCYNTHTNDIYAEVHKKPEDVTKLREKVQKYEKTNDELIKKNETLNMENNILKEELKLTKNEILKLNKEVEDTKRENSLLKQQNLDSGHNSLESSSHSQIKNLLQQLKEEKTKVSALEEELKKREKDSEVPDININKIEKINECIDKLDVLNSSLDKQYQRFNSLQSWISVTEDNSKEKETDKGVGCCLNSEIKELKSHLDLEENISKQKQESIQEIQMKFTSLLEDYKTLQSEFKLVKDNKSSVEQYQESLNTALSQIDQKEKELKALQTECDKLKETNEKLSSECALYKVQVEVYQSDFNEERAAREKLVGEKAELEERIRYLESNNNSRKKKQSHLCPKCNFSYSDFDTFQKHVDECIDTLFYP